MTSNKNNQEAYVWIYLPNHIEPVVAGKLSSSNGKIIFNYGTSYLERENAIPIFMPELPLGRGAIHPLNGLNIHGCLRDGSPDAWGRRVIINKKFGVLGRNIDPIEVSEITYMLESGSDRIGALDFQLSATHYEPREMANVDIEELIHSAEMIQKGIPLTPELAKAIQYGSPIGGARPKALVQSDNKKYIAKFSSSTDIYSVVKAEFIAMRLAMLAGINTAEVKLTQSSDKDVLLVERFDRESTRRGWERKNIVSALTILQLDEMMARYASYENFSTIIRKDFTNASATLKELFSRITFNILTGNTDDHARNHAAFWDGKSLSLTPAYDICPQNRAGNIASQAMLIGDNERTSKLSTSIQYAHNFLITEQEALQIIENQIICIGENWHLVCDEAGISEVDRNLLWGRQFLNSFSYEDLTGTANSLKDACLSYVSKDIST